jgi:ribosomal protein L29
MLSDHDRRQLLVALEESLGQGPAGSLMELLPPFGLADVARQSDLVGIRGEMAQMRADLKGEMADLRSELRGEMAGLRSDLKGEMAELRSDLKGEMAELRSELKGEMAGLRGEMAELRGELKGETAELRGETAELRGEIAKLSARVDAQLPRFVWVNVPIMFGVAGLVLGAARLA